MSKRTKSNKTEEDTLKHYESYNSRPEKDSPTEKVKTTHSQSGVVKGPPGKLSPTKTEFIKAEIAVDPVMSNRKDAVIKDPSEKKKK
jgi:hypothetical protein